MPQKVNKFAIKTGIYYLFFSPTIIRCLILTELDNLRWTGFWHFIFPIPELHQRLGPLKEPVSQWQMKVAYIVFRLKKIDQPETACYTFYLVIFELLFAVWLILEFNDNTRGFWNPPTVIKLVSPVFLGSRTMKLLFLFINSVS